MVNIKVSDVDNCHSKRHTPYTVHHSLYAMLFSSHPPPLRSLLRLPLLPFLRREAFRRPGMNGRDFRLQRRIDESMPREAVLLLEQGRHDHGLKRLAAAAWYKKRRSADIGQSPPFLPFLPFFFFILLLLRRGHERFSLLTRHVLYIYVFSFQFLRQGLLQGRGRDAGRVGGGGGLGVGFGGRGGGGAAAAHGGGVVGFWEGESLACVMMG